MSEPKRPLKVFLCHASIDKPKVRDLYKRLIADGVDAWLDAESLIPGQKWQEEIPKAIHESDVVIVCLTENSISKEGYVQKEIKYALDVAGEKPEGTIFIIPARLEECRVPNRLSVYHWVDLFDEGYSKLMKALKVRSAQLERVMTTLLDLTFNKVEVFDFRNEKTSENEAVLDRDYLLRKLANELESDGEDVGSIWGKSEEAIRLIVVRIAKRLGRAFDEIWDALARLGNV